MDEYNSKLQDVLQEIMQNAAQIDKKDGTYRRKFRKHGGDQEI